MFLSELTKRRFSGPLFVQSLVRESAAVDEVYVYIHVYANARRCLIKKRRKKALNFDGERNLVYPHRRVLFRARILLILKRTNVLMQSLLLLYYFLRVHHHTAVYQSYVAPNYHQLIYTRNACATNPLLRLKLYHREAYNI